MKDLFAGKRPLWFTFWIGYTIPVAIVQIIYYYAKHYSIALDIIFLVVWLAYLIAINWALWKSAKAHDANGGHFAGSLFVKGIVALNIIGIIRAIPAIPPFL